MDFHAIFMWRNSRFHIDNREVIYFFDIHSILKALMSACVISSQCIFQYQDLLWKDVQKSSWNPIWIFDGPPFIFQASNIVAAVQSTWRWLDCLATMCDPVPHKNVNTSLCWMQLLFFTLFHTKDITEVLRNDRKWWLNRSRKKR